MRLSRRSGSIDTMAVLLLYLLFAMLVIFTFVSGIRAYNSVRNKNSSNYSIRTTLQYISNKAKAYQKSGAISVGELQGKPALVITENLDGRIFCTYIYENDGKLYELFVEDGVSVDLSWGVEINHVEDFSVEKISDGLIRISSGKSMPLIIKVS